MDPAFHIDADPDPDPTFRSDPDPDTLFQFDPDPITHFLPDLDPIMLQNDHLRPPPFHFDAGIRIRNTASYHYSVSVFYTPRSMTGLALKWRRRACHTLCGVPTGCFL